jgi:hypothetical protein
VSAPRFLARVADAVGPLLGLRGQQLVDRLDVTAGLRAVGGGVPTTGFVLTANLLARLYPRIALDAPAELAKQARDEVLAINPVCELLDATAAADAWITWTDDPVADQVSVWASGCNVALDTRMEDFGSPEPAAALIAAALGASELFRTVFAAELGARGRSGATPFAFNIVTLGGPRELEARLAGTAIGCVGLVGAGAVGQAAALTVAESGARGNVVVVDPEVVELSNLQRYVLTRDRHVGVKKTKLAGDRLRAAGLVTNAVERHWTAEAARGKFDAVLVALDTERDRIGVAASLPGAIYNAWTQEVDLGWSRHEAFGKEPCLGCLHWPTGPRPHQYETIAQELGQHPLRVLAYLVGRFPGGVPLPADRIPVTPLIPTPPEATEWSTRSILDDVARAGGVDPARLVAWRDRPLPDFHREAVCAGALLELDLQTDREPTVVPLAHQSVIAGVMLAVQLLVARNPVLRAQRPAAPEARLDVLANLPQVFPRPRDRTAGCICSDQEFLAAARKEAA